MTSTDGENQMVAKGSTSSSKRYRNSVLCVAASDIKAEDKSSSVTVAEESEPEELGVSVPIKKQRIMVSSSSPSKRSFAQREGSEHKAQISDVPNEMPDCSGAEESVVQQQDASTLSTHVEGNDSSAVTVLEKSSVDEPTEKKNEGLKYVRLQWDLNLPMEAWGQPYDFEGEASGRDVEGEITESITPKESEPIDGSKEVIASDGPKADEAASGKDKEC